MVILSVALIFFGIVFFACVLFIVLPIGLFVNLEKVDAPLRLRATVAPFASFVGLGYEKKAADKLIILSIRGRDVFSQRVKEEPEKKRVEKPRPDG